MCVCVRPLEIVLVKIDRQTREVLLPTEYECVFHFHRQSELKFGSKKTQGPVRYDDLLAAMFSSSPEAQQIKLREMLGCDSCKKDVHHINVPEVFYRTTVEIEAEYLRKYNVIPKSAIQRMEKQRSSQRVKYFASIGVPEKINETYLQQLYDSNAPGSYLKRVWDTFRPTQSLQHVDADVGRRLLKMLQGTVPTTALGEYTDLLDFMEWKKTKKEERTAEGGAYSTPPPKVADTSSAQKRLEDSERSVERYKTELMKTKKKLREQKYLMNLIITNKKSDPSAKSCKKCRGRAGFCKSRGKEGHLPPLPESESDAESDASLNILADAASSSPNTKATASTKNEAAIDDLLEHLRTICAGKEKEVEGMVLKNGKITCMGRKARVSGYNIGLMLNNIKRSLHGNKLYRKHDKDWWKEKLQEFVHENFFKMEVDKADDFIQALRTIHEQGLTEGVERENGLISDIVPSCVVGGYNIGDIWYRAINYLKKNKSQKFYGHSVDWWKEQTKDLAILVDNSRFVGLRGRIQATSNRKRRKTRR